MINILTRIDAPWSGVSLYRSTGPFQHLRNKMDIMFMEPQSYNWMSIGASDVVFLERPHTDKDVNLVRMCNDLNKPVIVDYDDDLFNIPPWNPSYKIYDQHIKENIKFILSQADAVTCSTEHLANQLNIHRGTKSECVVIENALPSHLINPAQQLPPRNKMITWRGSNTHLKDICLVYESLKVALDKHPDWMMTFLGDPPYEAIERFGGRVIHIPSLEPVPYLNTLFKLAPSIHIVPLKDDLFNRSKSNVSYIEGAYAGARVIAPEWNGWENPGCWTYEDIADFNNSLLYLMECMDHSDGGHEYVMNNLTLDQVNLKRKNLFESFV